MLGVGGMTRLAKWEGLVRKGLAGAFKSRQVGGGLTLLL